MHAHQKYEPKFYFTIHLLKRVLLFDIFIRYNTTNGFVVFIFVIKFLCKSLLFFRKLLLFDFLIS